MVRVKKYILLAIVYISFLYAQVDSVSKTTELTPVEISNPIHTIASPGFKTWKLDSSTIKRNSTYTVGDMISQFTPNYTRNYGNGMLNTINVRGFGGERTNILWNGINLNNAGLGLIDLNILNAGLFNKIELLYGNSSSYFGNSSQGGSLILEYIPEFKKEVGIFATQEFGSFNTWGTTLQLHYGNEKIQGKTSFSRNSSTNDFAYRDKSQLGFPTKLLENARYFSYQGMQDVFFKLPKNWLFSFHLWFAYADRQIPASIGAAHNNQLEIDQNIRVNTRIQKKWNRHFFETQFAYLNDKIQFTSNVVFDTSIIHTIQNQSVYRYKNYTGWKINVGYNFTYMHSIYQNYGIPISEVRGNSFVIVNYNPFDELHLSAGIRQQLSSNFIAYPTGHISFEYKFRKKKNSINDYLNNYILGNFSSAYRMPTLNDLYWINGGNLNLKPEYSYQVELGYKFISNRRGFRNSLQINGYYSRTNNWIQWVPGSSGFFSPVNYKSVQNAGAELFYQFSYENKEDQIFAGIELNYAFIHALNLNTDKFMIYIPQHTIQGKLFLEWSGFYFHALPKFTTSRFTDANNTNSLPLFFLLNLQAGKTFHLKKVDLSILGRLQNTTDSEYELILNRPMPGASFNIGVNIHFKQRINSINK